MRWLLRPFDGLSKWLVRAAMFVFPPYELRRLGAGPAVQEEDAGAPVFGGKRWAAGEVQQAHLAAAEMIYRGELDRKKMIEDKAGSFLAGASLSAGLLIALPSLLAEKNSAPGIGKYAMLTVCMVAVIYLSVSAVYAVRVRAAGAYYLANSSSLEGLAVSGDDFRRRWAMQLVDLARRNQRFLLQKSNELYVAEQMFLRGLLMAIVAGLLLAALTIAYPAQREQRSTPAEVTLAIPFVYEGLMKCQESNSALGVQIAAQGSVLAEMRAQLDAKLRSDQQVRVKVSGKSKRTSRQRPADPESRKSQQRCPAPTSDGRGEAATPKGAEPASPVN